MTTNSAPAVGACHSLKKSKSPPPLAPPAPRPTASNPNPAQNASLSNPRSLATEMRTLAPNVTCSAWRPNRSG